MPNLIKTYYFCTQEICKTTQKIITMHLGTSEIILIALVVLLLFGGKKIPELMKGLGKGVKSFKDGMKGLEDDVKSDDKAAGNQADALS